MIKPRIQEIRHLRCPESIFNSISGIPYSFFLDGRCPNRRLSEYSILGWDPFMIFRSKFRKIDMAWRDGRRESIEADPFVVLEDILSRYRTAKPGNGMPCAGGAVGYFSYDLKNFLEELPDIARDDMGMPDCVLGFYDTVIVTDHKTTRSYIASSGFPETSAEKIRSRQIERIKEFKKVISSCKEWIPPWNGRAVSVSSNISKAAYFKAVGKAKEYIRKGDIYQVNLSQRFSADLTMEPSVLYRRLNAASPAPFSSYLNFDDIKVASSSPERFLRKKGRHIETRPIKGTRPRGADRFSDEKLRKALAESPKDNAEHVMIVDLERNDLGRICEYGSVRPAENAIIEEYPNVFHMVSTVTGRLKEGVSAVQALRATFPGGSITGAPKIRSMEIIEELEPVKRGLYTGAIGYISFDGDMDTSIAIRTFIVKGRKVYFSVGGGIVSDSDPESEYMETLYKARGMMEALGLSDMADMKTQKQTVKV
ncbi:MAG: aminodeoxychorismate synthase component I [Candidatus Omnitrophica bacterium]|nr:aminodeoxychorismate synthase component I [Candidatus Omnitrophota bacterium]